MEKLVKYIESAVTGLDAIQRAPIVNFDSGLHCLRIQDISQSKSLSEWGFTSAKPEEVKNFLIKQNDIFMARTGSTIGCSFFASNDTHSVFNNGLIRLRTNSKIFLPKYLFYLMQTISFRKYVDNVSMASATQPNIKINDLLEFECDVPSIKKQQHIVNTIGTVDDLIENLVKQNKKIINIGIIKINNLNNKTLKNLTEIVEFLKGREIGSLNYSCIKKDNMINYIRVSDLLSLGTTFVEYNKNLVVSNFDDILCAFDGAPGRNNIGLVGIYSSSIYNLKCDNLNKGLVFFEINSDLNQKIITKYSQGTTILHASKSISYLQYADIEIEDKIYFNLLFNLLIQNKKKIEQLTKIKSNLLNKFF